MASTELQRLWKLNQIDSGLVEIRQRAANLDVGKKLTAELEELKKQDAEIGGKARKLAADLTDLELTQKGIDDKLKKIDKQLYGGSVVNPREVENLEKEVASLKRQRDVNDEKILGLWDVLPPAKEAAGKIESKIAEKQKQLAERKKAALIEKATLESEFERLTKLRPDAARGINPGLMKKYDGIRQRMGGVGMAETTRKNACGGCGTLLPERMVQSLKDEKVVTCESCHRILYYSEGVV
jgi:predicted  nucleic acid-binding Zn-ribbon protein